MRRARLKLGFGYSDTPERRVLSLEADGIACVPAIGFGNYQRAWKVSEVHCHPECLEMSLCLRGSLEFPSPQHFATSFRHVTGVVPKRWKTANPQRRTQDEN